MADDERDTEVAARLEVEPLDDLTRRRLVSTALRDSSASDAPPSTRPSRAWRWIAAAAAVVVVLVGGLAVLTANGGHDEQQATRNERTALAPKAFEQALADAPDVGDFGDLDDAANLDALRAALDRPSSGAAASPLAPEAAGDAVGSMPRSSGQACAYGAIGTVIAQASGTIDGHPVTVVLLEAAGGARSVDALFQDTCELRHLFGSTP